MTAKKVPTMNVVLQTQPNGDVPIRPNLAKLGSSVTKSKPPNHLSYLLRLWGAGNGTESTWRASLEAPMTGERHGFASLRELFAFLQAQADDLASGESRTGSDVEPRSENAARTRVLDRVCDPR